MVGRDTSKAFGEYHFLAVLNRYERLQFGWIDSAEGDARNTEIYFFFSWASIKFQVLM